MTLYRFWTNAKGTAYAKGDLLEPTHVNNVVTALQGHDRATELAQAWLWRTIEANEAGANVMAVAYNTAAGKYLFAGTASDDTPKAWCGATITECLSTSFDSLLGTAPTSLEPYCALAAGTGPIQYLVGGLPASDTASKLRSSPNGSAWTARALSQAGTTAVTALSYDSTNGLYIAGLSAGATNVIETSAANDGATWAASTSSMAGGVHSIWTNAAGMSLAMSAGYDDDYLYSTNGTTWTAGTLPWSATEKLICYSEASGVWVAIGNGAQSASSTNGTTWTDNSAHMVGDLATTHAGLTTTGAVFYLSTYNGSGHGFVYVSWDDGVSWEYVYELASTSATRGRLINANGQIVGCDGAEFVYSTAKALI